jgi:hypothetical protein
VHLLLLYMCITGYKGVFEHSKHVRFSLVSGWTPCLSFWVGTWAAVSNFFFFVVIRPKPSIVRDFQFFPFSLSYLLTVRYFWWAIEEEAKSLCCCCCCWWWNLSLFIIWFNQYFFNTFSNQTEKSQSLLLFFKARSNRISISVYSFSYSLTKKEILKKKCHSIIEGRKLNFWLFVIHVTRSIFLRLSDVINSIFPPFFVLCITTHKSCCCCCCWRTFENFRLFSQLGRAEKFKFCFKT